MKKNIVNSPMENEDVNNKIKIQPFVRYHSTSE